MTDWNQLVKAAVQEFANDGCTECGGTGKGQQSLAGMFSGQKFDPAKVCPFCMGSGKKPAVVACPNCQQDRMIDYRNGKHFCPNCGSTNL